MMNWMMIGVILNGMIRGVNGEDGCAMQDGWVIRRAEEMVIVELVGILRRQVARITRAYKEAKE